MKQKINVAIQAYYIKTESSNDCLSCGKDIQHPICPNCLAEAFSQWIRKFPERQEIKNKLNTFMRQHNTIRGKSKTCVSCGKNRANICPYCFTKYLYGLIKEAGIGVRAMSEFLFIFNFDFTHKGYSRELEAHGGY